MVYRLSLKNQYFLAFVYPTFTPIECNDIKIGNPHEYDLCIAVFYPEDEEEDAMVLTKVNGEETVFEGKLLKEKRRVSVCVRNSSDPDDIEVGLVYCENCTICIL